MAVRGVVTAIDFFPADFDEFTNPLYAFQNHFPEPREIYPGDLYDYNSFQTTPITSVRDGTLDTVNITFVATAANVDLVETATANRYTVGVSVFRWNRNQGIDDPTALNIHSIFIADAIGGTADLATVTLRLGRYGDNIGADLPWRKIPWTILGPFSFRR